MSKLELQQDLAAAVNSLKLCAHLGFYPAENHHLEPMEKISVRQYFVSLLESLE